MSEVEKEEIPQQVEVIDIKIKLPSCISSSTKATSITIPSTVNATLGELKQSISIIHILRNFTSYDIYHHGNNLTKQYDDLFELEAIFEELNISLTTKESEDGNRLVNLTLKEKAYTLSSVYQHLEKFRESIGLNFLDRNAFGYGCSSGVSKFNDLKLDNVKESTEDEEAEKEGEENKEEEKKDVDVVLSDEEKIVLEDISSRLFSTSSLKAHSSFKTAASVLKLPIKSLSVSQWSPVPPNQRVKGDLLYLTLQTLENETINVTSHVSGFFVNKNSIGSFNPSLKVIETTGKSFKAFNLFDLISSVSTNFLKTIEENESKLSTFSPNHPEAYLIPSNCLISNPWSIETVEVNKPDISRSQLPLLYNGVDGTSNVKDWNEDIQSIKELPRASIDERILREQLLNKSTFEFTTVATETAMNIIRGDVPSINPQDEPERNVYLRNGIFYFMNVNDSGAFDETGGNEAARYTSSKDLASIKVLNKIDSASAGGALSLVTCIVDFMGKRVVCQAPVPGIFNNPVETESDVDDGNKVSYGLSVDRTSVYQDESFEAALKPITEALHLKAHEVNVGETSSNLVVSKDVKGIKGTDGRKYIMDLYRSTPLDIEFIESNWDSKDESKSYPHRETVLRHEAVEEWWKRKVSVLIKAETERIENEKKANGESAESNESTEKPQIVIPADQIVFNPDSFTGASGNKDDELEVRELSKFITEQLIPEFLNETTSQIAPFDGCHLSKSLHNQGINLRYLGYIATKALEKKVEEEKKVEKIIKENGEEIEKRKQETASKKDDEEKEEEKKEEESNEPAPSSGKFELSVANLDTLYRVSIQEMVARASKHVLRKFSSSLPVYLVPHFVAHFHNCLLAGSISSQPEVQIDQEMIGLFTEEELSFTKLSSKDIVELVTKEVFVRFRYELPANWETSNLIRPVQLLREIAIKYGIQWKAQDFAFTAEEFNKQVERTQQATSVKEAATSKKQQKKGKKSVSPVSASVVRSTSFTSEDIVTFVPIVKDSTFKSTLLDEIFEAARVHIYKNETEVGLTLLNELLSFAEQIYGRVHPETTRFYSSIAQIFSELNLKFEACNFGRKACILSERTSGFDSFETVLAYINASFFEGVNNDPVSSFKLYERVISDWDHIYGENHPSSINTVTNLAETLSKNQLYDASHKLFINILDVSDKLNGELSQVSGMIRYRYARSIFAAGNIKASLEQFKKANEIFGLSIGPDDIFTKETSELVSKFEDHLKYVEIQKKNEAAQQAQLAAQQAALAKSSASYQQSQSKKNGGKKAIPKPDPTIASQSVDDILKFINGNSSNKSKKSKKAKK